MKGIQCIRKYPRAFDAVQWLGTDESLKNVKEWHTQHMNINLSFHLKDENILRIHTYAGYNELAVGDWVISGDTEVAPILSFCKNPIYVIYKLFPDHKSYIESLDYGYLRGMNIDKKRFQEALEEFGIELPESIPGYKYI